MGQTPIATRPAGRYDGTSTGSSRTMISVGAVVVALITAWVIWDAFALTSSTVASSIVSQRVVDPTRIDVTLTIVLDPGRKAVCTVHALNPGKTVVGNVDVTVGPSTQKEFTSTVQVPTMEQAAGSEVKACVLA
jgi:hypothetical protein